MRKNVCHAVGSKQEASFAWATFTATYIIMLVVTGTG